MSQSSYETKQRMIRLQAAVLLMAMMSLPVISAQVGPKAPPPEKKPSGKKTGTNKATKKPVGMQPVSKPRASQAPVESQDGFIKIPVGEFMMGAKNGRDDEKPVHRVLISRSFEIGKYEVTQAQWESLMGSNPSEFKGANLPVERVEWDDVQQFIQKLNARDDGYVYRLPTEAEWEYACRAGSTGDYAGNLDAIAWYGINSADKTHPVGTKRPNAWGLYDMHGNAWEWCQDWYDKDYYAQSPSVDPIGPSTGSFHILRGGGWFNPARGVRSALRSVNFAGRISGFGVRLVRTPR